MADCCAELRSELAVLRAEVSKLGKVDEESIVQKAFNKSKDYLEPIIGGVSTVAIAAGVKATKAFDLGEVASIKAGNAFSEASAAGKVAQVAQKTSLAAEFAAVSAKTQAAQATGLAKVAQGAATVAGNVAAAATAFAATALGKALLALGQIVTLVGSIAGLFALYATLQVVFPRLDAHDAELQAIEAQLAKDSSSIFNLTMQVRRIEQVANEAKTTADAANYFANNAVISSIRSENIANEASRLSKEAIATAEKAQGKATAAENKANDAFLKSTTAIATAEKAQGKATAAENKANEAITDVKILTPKVENVIAEVKVIEPKVEDNTSKIQVLTPKVEDAKTTANFAFDTAITIKPIALEALQETKEIRPISEEALTKAFLSLNEIKVVKPVAYDAFTATQLQATELKGTQLEVGKLGTVTRDHGKTIELHTGEIQNLKTKDKEIEKKVAAPPPPIIKQPDTTKQDQMNDKALKDLQDQLRVGLGALTVGLAGITALMNPIARNTTPEALQTAAASGTCQTLQPGGCMFPLANNARNAANNSANNSAAISGIMAFLQGIQTLFLIPIKAGVELVNSKLGPLMSGVGGIGGFLGRLSKSLGIDRALNLIAIAANLHNAMMLSANLKVTLLEMLSSVGNATGLLETSEHENVDLNQVFNAGIEAVLIKIVGVDSYAGLKVGLRKYNAIYQAASNSLNAVSSMFNSIGNVIEQGAENTGRIGNALKGAGAVSEKAYQWMAEKFDAKSNKFIQFQSKIGEVTQFLETVNEIAETVVEGQQAATEFQKANTEFIKAVQDAKKVDGIENKAVQVEADKAKENAVKDPTGEIETGLLSFLTN